MIRWSNDPAPDAPRWRASVNGRTIAYATKTGSHLDDYPWDWYMDGDVYVFGRTSGVTDTLRAAKEQIATQWEGRKVKP